MKPKPTSAPAVSSASRAALAEAIVKRDQCKAARDDAASVVDRGRAALAAAKAAHSAAEAALAEARARAVQEVTRLAGGQPSALRPLRQAVEDAADDIEIASSALLTAEIAAGSARAEFFAAEKSVSDEVNLILYADIARHKTAVLELAHAKFAQVAIFEFLMHAGKVPSEFQRNATFASWHNTVGGFADPEKMRLEATAPWRAAREALMQDPDAPLPAA